MDRIKKKNRNHKKRKPKCAEEIFVSTEIERIFLKMSQKTPKLVHLSCRFVLSLFEVALRSAAIYDVRGVILVIEDLQQLRLGVVE